jgi:2-aminoadipate transaminase
MKVNGLSALGRRTEAPPVSWLMGTALAHPNLISLAAGFTDSESLPTREAREILRHILGSQRCARGALQYGTTAGDPALRQLTAERVCALDAQPGTSGAWSPDRVLITNGSQQLLYMITEALCDPGDLVLVEDPSYFVYLGILQSHGIKTRGVSMRPDGLDVEHLESILQELKRTGRIRRLKLLYSVSYYQNPSGITTRFQKKAGALALLRTYERAAGHPIYFLEDAAYRELRFQGKPVPSSLGLSSQRVIYAGTYSKPFATGVRIGFGFLPPAVLTPVMHIKGNHDFGSSNLLQQMLARALESGLYEKHLARVRKRYARKAQVMSAAIRDQFPSVVECREPEGGLYCWARLPQSIKSGARSNLFKEALVNEIIYVPGELCYAQDPTRPKPNHELRLSFGAESEANIREGIKRLGVAFRKLTPELPISANGRRRPELIPVASPAHVRQ